MYQRKAFSALGVAFVAATALFLPACGGDESAESTTTTAAETTTTTEATTTTAAGGELSDAISKAAAESAEENGIDVKYEECYLGTLAADLGEDRALELNGDEGTTDEAELDAVADAADECYPPEALAESVAAGFAEETGVDDETSAKVGDCFAGQVDGRVGEFAAANEYQEAEPGDEASNAVISELFEACFDSKLIATLVTSDLGATDEQVDCLAKEIDGKVTFTQILEQDEAAGDAIAAAGETCGLDG